MSSIANYNTNIVSAIQSVSRLMAVFNCTNTF